ncbi:MAG: electron transport complex subunit RsxC [Clostridiales bacterium]|nr:MAG: electron transport complex subunit RsxC [Clostridiales bacterium]
MKRLRGVHLSHHKYTAERQTERLPLPPKVQIPMLQHMGAPCVPKVAVGDHVKVGQKIGESENSFSVPIHSSVSGDVIDVSERIDVGGRMVKTVTIMTDGKQEISEEVVPPVINNKSDFINAVYESGLAGLGGAGFPGHVKLAYKDIDRVTKLVVNAAECEPYITADYRECMERPGDIIEGIRLVKKWLDIQEVYIGVEDNKPIAIDNLTELLENDPDINVIELESRYPQGAEKVIIYACTGIVVEEGKLPADCGVIVMNVSSISFLARYMRRGMPLTTKRLTVDGGAVNNPKNVFVPIGTSIRDLLNFCGGIREDCRKILMGGPMMGIAVYDLDAPVIKNNNAILALTKDQVAETKETACIRCGRCIYACPMRLMPRALEMAYDNRNAVELERGSVNLCMNCGCCSYVCPAKRNLAQKNQLAKIFLRQTKQK